jgi:hypothetical protein
LSQYFENVAEVKDARFRDQCTMECEFCDCTRSIKLPGKQLMNELSIAKEKVNHNADFTDIGRIKLNRKKQKEEIKGLKILHNNNNDRNLKPIFAGLFAIFYDGVDYFRVKNIPDNDESRLILRGLGLDLYGIKYGHVIKYAIYHIHIHLPYGWMVNLYTLLMMMTRTLPWYTT